MGGELAKEVAFIYVFVTILSKPILLCLVARWFSFSFFFFEAVILYSLIFQKLYPLFVVLPNLQVGKLKLCLNPVDVRLMSCLVEWMIS